MKVSTKQRKDSLYVNQYSKNAAVSAHTLKTRFHAVKTYRSPSLNCTRNSSFNVAINVIHAPFSVFFESKAFTRASRQRRGNVSKWPSNISTINQKSYRRIMALNLLISVRHSERTPLISIARNRALSTSLFVQGRRDTMVK